MLITMGTMFVLWGFALLSAANPCRQDAHYPGSQTLPAGETTRFSLDERSALVHVPQAAGDARALPLILDFHGWGGSAESLLAKKPEYAATSDAEGFVVAIPDGMADNGKTSWNGLTNTASTEIYCDMDWVMNVEACYDSCAANGQCEEGEDGKYKGCIWATCVDDVAFVEDLIDSLSKELCIDQDRVYATGYSNGALMVYALAQALPHRIAAAVPASGLPHWGFGDPEGEVTWVPERGAATPLLHLTGIDDRTCPPYPLEKIVDWYGVVRSENGPEDYPGRTVSADGWFYEPMETVVGKFAEMAGCDADGFQEFAGLASIESEGLACKHSPGCPTGQFAGFCTYPKGHRWPDNYVKIVWEFAKNYRLARNDQPFASFDDYKAYCQSLEGEPACNTRCIGGKFRSRRGGVCKPPKKLSKLRCKTLQKSDCLRLGCKFLPRHNRCAGSPFSQS